MRDEIGLTPDVESWAEKAGYSVTESSACDGRAIIWDSGGEIRYFIGKDADDWIVVSRSERMGEEQLEVACQSAALVERRFVAIFARLVRSHRGLPRLSRPSAEADIAAGYSIGAQEFGGKVRRTLINPAGSVVAIVAGGSLVGTANAVELSVLATSTLEQIVQSMVDPEGKPLFSVRGD